MSKSARLGEAELCATLQREPNRVGKRDPVADADIHRIDAWSRAKDTTEQLSFVMQGLRSANRIGRCIVYPAEPALGAAQCGAVDQYAEMAGNPEAARVCQTLSVHHEHIRLTNELAGGGDQ